MQDSDSADRPQRRSALVARELARLNIDIAAVSEVRFAEQGSLTEQGAGYTLYWSGKAKDDRRLSGVGFMITNSIISRLDSLPVGHSYRLMSLRLPLLEDQYATIISVYAPTLQADPTTKESFYSELRSLLQKTKDTDKVFIMGDFNARVGRDHTIWPGVLGRHGIGNCNDNRRLLLELCAEHSLTITNTLFQQKARFKTTWKHPRSKHWHLLDYILVRQKDVKDVLHTRVMPSADCYTDHRLVRATARVIMRPAVKRKTPQIKTLQVDQLPLLKEKFQSELESKLAPTEAIDTDPEKMWQDLKSTLQETTAEVVGFTTRKNKDWFDESDEEIQQLISDKRSCHQRVLSNPGYQAAKESYRQACCTLQKKLREIQNDWWLALAQRTQRYADTGNSRAFYEALHAVYGPTHQIQAPLRSADGSTLLTDKKDILNRWAEHYGTLFSDTRSVEDASLDSIQQLPVKHELDEPPSFDEVQTAARKTNSHKAPGIDGLPAEVYKYGGDQLLEKLTSLFTLCWSKGEVPLGTRSYQISSKQ
ncbi:craniofacial development protein 2-like [Montipora capricornis]|uniref:craniofacial development protein 2-like n=1 Tax=Montipora capricornis TaxID=246305 RepID=UPI0035F15FF4